MTQALPSDFRLVPAGGREDIAGVRRTGTYFAALEVRVGARVGRSIALSSSQTHGHNITRGSLNQGGDAELGGEQAASLKSVLGQHAISCYAACYT
jgi:hypothetical protein